MSVNKATILGRVGQDPEIRSFQNGDRVANFTMATSDKWKDKATGEKKEKTCWHNISVFGGLVNIVEKYVSKGSQLYIEGEIENSSYEKDGVKKYVSKIVLKGYGSKLELLGGANQQPAQTETATATETAEVAGTSADEFDDEIPFLAPGRGETMLDNCDYFLIEDGKVEKPIKIKCQNKYTVTGVVDGKVITIPNEKVAVLKRKVH